MKVCDCVGWKDTIVRNFEGSTGYFDYCPACGKKLRRIPEPRTREDYVMWCRGDIDGSSNMTKPQPIKLSVLAKLLKGGGER